MTDGLLEVFGDLHVVEFEVYDDVGELPAFAPGEAEHGGGLHADGFGGFEDGDYVG